MARDKTQGASTGKDRRQRLEEMRKAEARKERRKNLLVVGTAGVLGLGLVAAAAIPAYLRHLNDPANRDWSEFGVAAGAAGCQEVEEISAEGQGAHLPTGESVDYEITPPAAGPHWNLPAEFASAFYTAEDRPPVEELVHRLEHGHTVLWYDPTDVSDAELDEVRELADKARASDAAQDRFIAAPWTEQDGEFPEDASYVLAHWGTEQAYRQVCSDLSGEVVGEFVQAYPWSNAPEAGAI